MSRESLLLYSKRGNRLAELNRTLERHFEVLIINDPADVEAQSQRPIAAAIIDAGGKNAAPRTVVEQLRGRSDGKELMIGLLRSDQDEISDDQRVDPETVDTEIRSDLPVAVMLSAFWTAYERRDAKAWDVLDEDSRAALFSAKDAFDVLGSLATGQANPEAARLMFTDAAEQLARAASSNRATSMIEQLRDHHNYTFAHSAKVSLLLSGFGAAIGLGEGERRLLAEAGLLHDVGKLQIPIDVLAKPGPLTEHEFEIMQGHAAIGGDILQEVYGDMPEIAIAARHHHEKLDGSGYPDGLKGIKIHEFALISAVIDIYAALTDKRDYKEALSTEKAFEIMRPMANRQIERKLFREFEQFIQDGVAQNIAA